MPEAPWQHLGDASYGAALSYLVVVAVILVQRLRGKRGSRFERWLMAVFLASMPLVYVSAAARSGAPAASLALEVGGFIAFATVAVLGMRVSPWFLVGGIVAHGVGWDLWHHGRASFMQEWYPVGCLAGDIVVALYAAAQVEAWTASPAIAARG